MIILKSIIRPVNVNDLEFSPQDKEIGLKNYSVISFGRCKFYLPLNACSVSYLNDELRIVFKRNTDTYGIVDGIRCYDVIVYDKEKDTMKTYIREFILDGAQRMEQQLVSFIFGDQKICVLEKNRQEVTPWRHYEELATAFLSEFPEIDARIGRFLRNHPECFGNSSKPSDSLCNYVYAWKDIHYQLTGPKTSKGVVKPDLMDEDVFQLFVKENPGL